MKIVESAPFANKMISSVAGTLTITDIHLREESNGRILSISYSMSSLPEKECSLNYKTIFKETKSIRESDMIQHK